MHAMTAKNSTHLTLLCILAIFLNACSSGNEPSEQGTSSNNTTCSGSCTNANSFLSVNDVRTILAQAISEAQARNINATIAVVDRVGNVLATFRMNGADTNIIIDGGRNIRTGLDGLEYAPDNLVAISKAVTAAYLSSEGNAFTTRTASQIVQQNFNPGEADQPGGPLFGVQFSNLPCSDFMTRFSAVADAGPKRSPLGLSADPGGLPLYKAGSLVGGIGVIADGRYGLDLNAGDLDQDTDELIAMAGSFNYAAPQDRRADRITVEGKTLRFADINFDDLLSTPANAADFATLDGTAGNLLAVPGYSNAVIIDGTAFGQSPSGIRSANTEFPGLDAFVIVDNSDVNRYPPSNGSEAVTGLTVAEVRQLLQSAISIANRSRAQIRRPLGSQARVTVAITDTNGNILGLLRTRDAPVFGSDVAIQKARTAAFFSGSNAANDLTMAPNTIYLQTDTPVASGTEIVLGDYVTAARNFLGLPNALADGSIAFTDRAGGNLSRPYFPDGLIGSQNGPFSKPFVQWSPFSTGLQLDLVMNRVVQHVLFVAGAGADTPANCTTLSRLANGIQIFPGSVPIYRDDTLIGGIGVSGDGVDQDDMIAFLAVDETNQTLGSINNAQSAMRADTLTPQGTRLRFVQCPQAPFLNSEAQNVCDGK